MDNTCIAVIDYLSSRNNSETMVTGSGKTKEVKYVLATLNQCVDGNTNLKKKLNRTEGDSLYL